MRERLFNKVAKSILNEPTRWKHTSNIFKRDDGLEIWTANGLLFLDLYPWQSAFNLIEKIRLKKIISQHSHYKF